MHTSAPLIDKTPEYETRAAADVAALGTFPAPWPDKLTVLRALLSQAEAGELRSLIYSADRFRMAIPTSATAMRSSASWNG